jgi:hypothetical protein
MSENEVLKVDRFLGYLTTRFQLYRVYSLSGRMISVSDQWPLFAINFLINHSQSYHFSAV